MKSIKKVVVYILVLGMLVLNAKSSVVFADNNTHKRPGTSADCNSTIRSFVDYQLRTTTYIGTHYISGGVTCVKYGMVFQHFVYCSSCNALLNDCYVYCCTEAHNKCSTRIENHPAFLE